MISRTGKLEFFSDDDVVKAVCDCYRVGGKDFWSRCREEPIADARFMAMFVLYDSAHYRIAEIARLFDRKHCTVIHGIRKIKDLLDVDEETRLNHSIILERCRAALQSSYEEEMLITG